MVFKVEVKILGQKKFTLVDMFFDSVEDIQQYIVCNDREVIDNVVADDNFVFINTVEQNVYRIKTCCLI